MKWMPENTDENVAAGRALSSRCGRTIAVNNEKELTQAVTYIGLALRSEYVLAYRVEKRAIDGKWHKVRVSLLPLDGRDVSRLHLYAKAGYYASHSK